MRADDPTLGEQVFDIKPWLLLSFRYKGCCLRESSASRSVGKILWTTKAGLLPHRGE
jgi:hypothetical protein